VRLQVRNDRLPRERRGPCAATAPDGATRKNVRRDTTKHVTPRKLNATS
jgi:hypothetical protein